MLPPVLVQGRNRLRASVLRLFLHGNSFTLVQSQHSVVVATDHLEFVLEDNRPGFPAAFVHVCLELVCHFFCVQSYDSVGTLVFVQTTRKLDVSVYAFDGCTPHVRLDVFGVVVDGSCAPHIRDQVQLQLLVGAHHDEHPGIAH